MMTDTPSDEMPSRPEYMLTTMDNPFDPFEKWDEWYAWDLSAGYNTLGLLARVAQLGDDLPDGDQQLAIQLAIDEIVKENVTGVFMKVKKGDAKRFRSIEL